MSKSATATPTANPADAWWVELERLARVLGECGPDEVCCEGLTPRQTGLLRTLVARQGVSLSALAQEAGVTPGAMTRLLERMEARGLVQRVRGAQGDLRASEVRITRKGRQIRSKIDQLMLDRASAILAAIPVEDRAMVFRSLQIFNQALEQAGLCCAPGQQLVKIAKEKSQ